MVATKRPRGRPRKTPKPEAPKRPRGRPCKPTPAPEDVRRSSANRSLDRLYVWLIVERQLQNMPRRSVKRACELLVAAAQKQFAAVQARVDQLNRKEAAAGAGVMAAKRREAKRAGDVKWSEAMWLKETLQQVDKRALNAETLRRHYVEAERVRRLDPSVATYLARELEVARKQ
ncbi:hypothetical protein JQ543_16230 [Bradyrhizobium diazoefficiens]|nr:hypothetical protein [Bradyrhizobium diazoefficiens]MBR0849302.1 hypothetical protein [Bradyrhizobium diazoefficiens]